MLHFSQIGQILVRGDLNSRTNTALDFIDDNEVLKNVMIESLNFEDITYQQSNNETLAPRVSQDIASIKGHGKSILEICKSTN